MVVLVVVTHGSWVVLVVDVEVVDVVELLVVVVVVVVPPPPPGAGVVVVVVVVVPARPELSFQMISAEPSIPDSSW